MASNKVTVEKAYLDTLLRKAQFLTDGVGSSAPVHVPTVTISRAEHDSLLKVSREYANLKRNLFRGGVVPETLAVLVGDDAGTDPIGGTSYLTLDDPIDSNSFFPESTDSVPQDTSGNGPKDRNANYTSGNGNGNGSNEPGTNGYANGYSYNDDYDSSPDPRDHFYQAGPNNNSQSRNQRPQFEKFAKRTILLSNLPDGTTHAEITDVVRGGMLLDVYVRANDRNANVSFLEESAAQDFFRYAKRHDLYIRGKRIEIRWNERQFILPGHVANKISIGATRNLVIQNYNPSHTEQVIRDDLEHIHNLIVIKVDFRGPNCYIATNSVHNSMFARTCMMSRATYKGSKINWDIDECAAPLERPQQCRENIPAKERKEKVPLTNRFEILNMDENEEEGSTEDDDLDNSGISLPSEGLASSLRRSRYTSP
ncbi:related to RNA binding protein Nrd1 [Rhynchosporium agropyri]|uniref:Related to RNA binding protein Nrd1 n=1 Tax=Rhynchosporium agropyri TaxID=914238 RepID=A0A1E1JY97_9HELO|nr:related to RNA binding protein Nrd1 [Rhynchosporium agropyri]